MMVHADLYADATELDTFSTKYYKSNTNGTPKVSMLKQTLAHSLMDTYMPYL